VGATLGGWARAGLSTKEKGVTVDQQMNLGLRRTERVKLVDAPAPRRRAILIEDDDALTNFDKAMGVIDGFAELAKSWTDKVQARPRTKTKIEEPVIEVTNWVTCDIEPPCSGYWDVKVIDEAEVVRMAYTKATNSWTVAGWPFPRVFGRGRMWRGLAQDPYAK
jgi:hypothetical protein